eukprot:CAMPEP_0197844242 /NCGR_PEP_ID=MMETSP1438-20131217/1233_1 /TAXON_ID=1461541 /ORGANISM="Pterosperma sp., Strain CCMP1384" /LENGTH=58 /DNA_ID=CAMNT_0043454937 /DNA_START=356 /DNA_END=529 /DNA_ORIENTATION=-
MADGVQIELSNEAKGELMRLLRDGEASVIDLKNMEEGGAQETSTSRLVVASQLPDNKW